MKSKTQKLPPLVYTIGINKSVALQMTGIGTLLFFLAGALFSSVTRSGSESVFNGPLLILVCIGTLGVHELVHGLFFKLFGGHPKYGVGVMYYFLPYAYATAEGQPYTLVPMLIVGMSPFVLVCAAALGWAFAFPAMAPYAAIAFVTNFSGAVGDMWLMRQVLRFRNMKQLLLVDERNGLAIHARDPRAKAIATQAQARSVGSAGRDRFIKVWAIAFAVLVLLSSTLPVVLAIAGYKGHLLIGFPSFSLLEVNTADQSNLSFGFNPLASALTALIFSGLYMVLVRRPKK